jgi:hypothetical protein
VTPKERTVTTSRTAVTAAAAAVDFTAFVQLHKIPYEEYAQARLVDQELSRRAVAAALRSTEFTWTLLLSGPSATARAWLILRETVTSARGQVILPNVDFLHMSLPAHAADAALLYGRLGYQIPKAAQLMGLPEPDLHVGLMIARRELVARGQRREESLSYR